MKPSARDALLRLCTRAYPRAARERDGDAISDLAIELVEAGSSPLREAAGLVAGGWSVRLRGGARGLAAAPWGEARAALALPLAAALFALAATAAGRAGVASYWVGWSVVVLCGAAAVTLAGAAAGHRWVTALGALGVTGMLGLDALRDVYGQTGSRYDSEVGSALVDVLVMWIPVGLLMVVCAGAVTRVPANVGIRRLVWGLVPGVALLAVASEPTRVIIADRIVVFGVFVAAAVLVLLAIARRGSDRVLPLATGLIVAVATPPATWLVAAFLPPPDTGASGLILAYWAAAAAFAGSAVVLLARLGRPAETG